MNMTSYLRLARLSLDKKIEQIVFYLDEDDIDFTEQPNEYGKSLFRMQLN
jgi:hypothetical protein